MEACCGALLSSEYVFIEGFSPKDKFLTPVLNQLQAFQLWKA